MKTPFLLLFGAVCALLCVTISVRAEEPKPPVLSPLQHQRLLALAGYAPLEGEGLVITLSDRSLPPRKNISAISGLPGLVHDYDVLFLVNELRASGATGISVGGVRLTNASAIRCIGPQLLVGSQKIAVPIRVEAVGNGALLRAGLNIRGGFVEQMRLEGPKTQVSLAARLKLRAAALPRLDLTSTTGK